MVPAPLLVSVCVNTCPCLRTPTRKRTREEGILSQGQTRTGAHKQGTHTPFSTRASMPSFSKSCSNPSCLDATICAHVGCVWVSVRVRGGCVRVSGVRVCVCARAEGSAMCDITDTRVCASAAGTWAIHSDAPHTKVTCPTLYPNPH